MTDATEGWYWPSNSRKAHFYVDGRSLCRRSMVIAAATLDADTGKGPDDCAECRRRLDKRKGG